MSPVTIIVLLLLGVMLFGGKLPEMARDIGKSLLEFQRGMNEWGNEAKKTIFDETTSKTVDKDDPVPVPEPAPQETSAPKFEPPAE
ncbi:MAG: twin-arginine translocase TatA/TatE family subunit [Planctomycetaceae bacterium]|nr:twin-arginine translocase TatA/TatE family subunit [Planctomycetaceae bacterium]